MTLDGVRSGGTWVLLTNVAGVLRDWLAFTGLLGIEHRTAAISSSP